MVKRWIRILLVANLLLVAAACLLVATYVQHRDAQRAEAAWMEMERLLAESRESKFREYKEQSALEQIQSRYAEQGFSREDVTEIRYVRYDGEQGAEQRFVTHYRGEWIYRVFPYSPSPHTYTLDLPRETVPDETVLGIVDKLLEIDALAIPWSNADGRNLYAQPGNLYTQQDVDVSFAEEHWTIQIDFRNHNTFHSYTWNVWPDDSPTEEMLAVRELVEERMRPHYRACLALAEEMAYELPEQDQPYSEHEIAKIAAQDWYRENGLNRLETFDPFPGRSGNLAVIDWDGDDEPPEEEWQLVYYRDRFCWLFLLEGDLRFCYDVINGQRVTPQADELVYALTRQEVEEIVKDHARAETSYIPWPYLPTDLRFTDDGAVRYLVDFDAMGSYGDMPYRKVATYWVDPLTGEVVRNEWY